MTRTGLFAERLARHEAELHGIYEELYHDEAGYGRLVESMRDFYAKRSAALKELDRKREEKLDYLSEQKITYLHLMPLLKMPHPMNDGGYAVEDFRTVDPQIGTNRQLSVLTGKLRERGISLCLDVVMNHTADTHEWAMRAKAGEKEYQDRYQCYDTYDIPSQFEQTMAWRSSASTRSPISGRSLGPAAGTFRRSTGSCACCAWCWRWSAPP